MRKFNEFFEETAWLLLFWVLGCGLSCLFFLTIFSEHKVNGYYLTGESSTSIIIRTDIDWCIDYQLFLDRNITYDEAVNLVNKLNEGFSKN